MSTGLFVDGDDARFDAERVRPHLVEGIGDVGERDLVALVEEGREAQREHLVAAVADKDVLRFEPVFFGDHGSQFGAVGVGVQPEVARRVFAQRFFDCGRGRIGALVCVEFDVRLVARLFAGGVRADRSAMT